MQINKHNLPNGFSVITSEDNSNSLVSLQLFVRMGSSRENSNQAGFSHFTEHLVFKSTKLFPANSIMERVSFLGGNINAYTEFDTTCFYITIPSKFTAEAIEILTEIVRYANWNEEDFESEKSVVIEELKQYQDDPEDFFIEEIAQKYFKKNNYRKPIIGDLKSLNSCQPNELRDFYREYYSPSNCFMIATGDFLEKDLLGMVNNHFGDWEKKKVVKLALMKEDYPVLPEVNSWEKDISNDWLAFVLPDLAETDNDANALALAAKTFGIGKNSRLFHRLYEVEKLIDTIKVHSLSGLNSGITIYLVLPKKGADIYKIVEIFVDELKLLNKYGLTVMEIEDKKRELLHNYRYSFEYVESLASSLGNEEVLSDYTRFMRYPKDVSKLDKSWIDQAIKKYYKLCSLYIYHLGKNKIDQTKIMGMLTCQETEKQGSTKEQDFLQTTLDNGMRVCFKRVKGKPTVGVSISYRVSQLNESVKNLGTNVMTSSLLLYGNENRSYKQLMNYCTSNGINLGISPSMETTNLKLKCFTEMLPDSLEIISDVLQKPIFPKHYFENLRSTFNSNLSRISDYPQYYAHYLWSKMFFGSKSNMIAREGNKSTLHALSRKRLLDWYQEHYVPSNISLAIVGDFNFEEILATCQHLFENMETKEYQPKQQIILNPTSNKIQRNSKGLNQANINLGGWACSLENPYKSTAFHVLAQIIGGESDSILFEELRENLGVSYASHFGYTSLLDSGFYSLTALVDKKREQEALDAIYNIFETVKTDGITAEDLQRTKNYIRGQRLMDQESVLSQAQTISVLDSIGLGYQFYLDRDKRLEQVNVDQLQDLAKEYLNQDKFFVHILD